MPSIPQNFVAQSRNGDIWLTWDLVGGATSYDVQRDTDPLFGAPSSLSSPTLSEYLDSSGTLGTLYYYRVRSDDGSSQSDWSEVVSEVPVASGTATLGQLRLRAQQRADRVNSDFVTTSEWNQYINESYQELYGLLVQKFGDEYFLAPPLLISTSGSNSIELPNGTNHSGAPAFFKLKGVDMAINQSAASPAYVTLTKYNFINRNQYVYPQLSNSIVGYNRPQYRVMGTDMFFIPTPPANMQVQLWYVPRLTELLKDIDVADGVNGWLEYVEIDAAIKALNKEESDVSVLAAQKMAIMRRIEAEAGNRDVGLPNTVSDVSGRLGWFGGPEGDGGPWGGA